MVVKEELVLLPSQRPQAVSYLQEDLYGEEAGEHVVCIAQDL